MITITTNTLDEFYAKTKKNIVPFFRRATAFFTTSYPDLVDYYSGQSVQITQGVFTQLALLEEECSEILVMYKNLGTRLNNAKWWVLLDYIEQIDSQLKTARNINKWSKSSIATVAYNPVMQVPYTLKPKQTLERVAQDILKSTNPSDDWVDIALQNQLTEEDYSITGGTSMTLGFPQVNNGVAINAVVDVMIGDNIYGKDLDRFFGFDEDTNDLRILSPSDTLMQSIFILAALRQNDNPDYPTEGIQSSIVAGSNRATLSFPIINRQMSATFATDDTLQNFQITNLETQGVGLLISFSVEPRLQTSSIQQTTVVS